jgi:hypothetical protein
MESQNMVLYANTNSSNGNEFNFNADNSPSATVCILDVLPNEILCHIFSFLHDGHKSNVVSVCKRFLSLIFYEEREYLVTDPRKKMPKNCRRMQFDVSFSEDRCWNEVNLKKLFVPESVREIRIINFFANVKKVHFPPLNNLTIMGALSKGLFKNIRKVDSKITLYVNKILIDSFKWNLSDPDPNDKSLGWNEKVKIKSFDGYNRLDYFSIIACDYLRYCSKIPELIDLSLFRSKDYEVQIYPIICNGIPSIEIKLPEHAEKLKIKNYFFQGSIILNIPNSLKTLETENAGYDNIEIKRNGANVKLESLEIKDVDIKEPTGILKALLALIESDQDKMTILEIRALKIKTAFVCEEFFYLLEKILCKARVQELSLMLEGFFKRRMNEIEECDDENQEAKYTLTMPKSLKKLHVQYELQKVKLQINCGRKVIREIVFPDELKAKIERNLTIVEKWY